MHVCIHSPSFEESDFSFMGEALMTSRAQNMKSVGAGEVTVLTTNTTYTVPYNGIYRITCIGGGGSGSNSMYGSWFNAAGDDEYRQVNGYTFMYKYGAGSGCATSEIQGLTAGTTYPVTIGAGGNNIGGTSSIYNGGISSFGTLVSANGGAGCGWWYSGRMRSGYMYANYGGNAPKNAFIIRIYDNGVKYTGSGGLSFNNGRDASSSTGLGGVIYMKGSNFSYTPLEGYIAVEFGAGGNSSSNVPCGSIHSIWYNNAVNGAKTAGFYNSLINRPASVGKNGAVVIEYLGEF